MTDRVLSGLVKRRAALAGELEASQAKVGRLHANLAAVDAVIRRLDPACPLNAVATKRARGPDGTTADMGRTAPDVLRRAGGPLITAAVAERAWAPRDLSVRCSNTRERPMRTLSGTPLAAAAALMLLAATSACAPGPRYCTPQPDRFDTSRGFARENYAEVHPAMAVAAVAVSAAGLLTGARCN